ncbi:MAG: aminotransferase class I/II-fold pyridoxal phosphate-dependent enzyme, partial [Pseudomonadota bacterium]
MTNEFQPSLGSDNHSGVHPKILQALVDVNVSHSPSYGTDPITAKVNKTFQGLFGDRCQPFFVFNGTAANVLCIQSLIPSWQSVICTDVSHLNLDECAAPERIAGVKLETVPSRDGKLNVNELEDLMIRKGDQHFSSPGLISITQPTELGTVYTLKELSDIRAFASRHELLIHVDGARLSNCLIALDCSFEDIVQTLKPDAISFGGTKNGLLGVEAVLLFDDQR